MTTPASEIIATWRVKAQSAVATTPGIETLSRLAVLLYASILFVITDFLVSLFLIIVGFLSGTLWLFINIGANFFNQIDDDNDKDEVKDKEEPKVEAKPEEKVKSERKEEVKKEVIEPEVVNDTPRDLNNKEDK